MNKWHKSIGLMHCMKDIFKFRDEREEFKGPKKNPFKVYGQIV